MRHSRKKASVPHWKRRIANRLILFPTRVHSDERGSISLASVFALLLLVFLLGMVMNASRQVDQKVKMQNAADAATYSGGVVIVRSMNTLAFTNHLLSDVIALTAYMREARERRAESLTPEILANWERVAPAFAQSPFPKFAELGEAIQEKVPHEREMIRTYGEWAAAASERMLPVLEEILAQEMIPEFQRALVATTPQLSQFATDEVARRHGAAWPRQGQLRGVLWRTIADPVGGPREADRRSIPVVDPVLDAVDDQQLYIQRAKQQRWYLAFKYLNDWNESLLEIFDEYGKMSQYSRLWRIFSRGELKKLCDKEYPDRNLPFQIRTYVQDGVDDVNEFVETDFMFIGVVYNEKLPEKIPGVFSNPVDSDSQAYAQIMVFVPRRRLVIPGSSSTTSGRSSIGGVPGDTVTIIPPRRNGPYSAPSTSAPSTSRIRMPVRQTLYRYPDYDTSRRADRISGTDFIRWDLVNQNWTMQLVPATARNVPAILSSQPDSIGVIGIDTPDLQTLNDADMRWLGHH